MNKDELQRVLWEVIEECLSKGAGYSQEGVVLREVGERLNIFNDQRIQQDLLTIWHDQFRAGHLSWGLNIDNPNAPFFHKPNR